MRVSSVPKTKTAPSGKEDKPTGRLLYGFSYDPSPDGVTLYLMFVFSFVAVYKNRNESTHFILH
jgi:hypothetical protein